MSELTKTSRHLQRPEGAGAAAAATLLVVAIIGLCAGVATSWLQGELSGGWSVLADSGAVWTVVAFGLAAVCAGPRWAAVTAGTLALLCEVAGYYVVAAASQGIAVTVNEQVLWTVAALWIGPLAGVAAYYWRRGSAVQSVLSGVAVAGLVAGEGLHLVRRAGRLDAGWGELVAAAALAAVVLATSRTARRYRGAALVAGGAVALVTYAVYGQTILTA